MSSSKYKMHKIDRKQRRCEIIIQNELHIKTAETVPTNYLGILNSGISNGLTEESVLLNVEKYGKISKLLMLPKKSYCFIECPTKEDARNIYEGLHGKAKIGQNNALIYLSYFDALPNIEKVLENKMQVDYPSGLHLLEDFITADEEVQLLAAVNMDFIKSDDDNDNYNGPDVSRKLKYRKVKHFGYEFSYATNNIDITRPLLDRKIPEECNILWSKLDNWRKEHLQDKWDWQIPDQLTVNVYEPGQGIPCHVDTHSAFLEPILSLSLKSDIVMEFRRGEEKFSVCLPQRSLLIMSGETRYDWMHCITPRMYDVITTPSCYLSTQRRQQRVSLTFRAIRKSKLCNCKYPTLCDSKRFNNVDKEIQQQIDVPLSVEDTNVHQVYERIAEHFSETRHTPWPKVKEFLQGFPLGCIILDVGCGNGKYLNCNPYIFNMGCDRSANLLKLCRQNKNRNECFQCDCLDIPIRSDCLDGCISIAVIHHLSTRERRLQALREMARVVKPKGRALVYVWAKNQNVNNQKSNYLKDGNKHETEKPTRNELQDDQIHQMQLQVKQTGFTLPIHKNRTEFVQQDILVPWKTKMKDKEYTKSNVQTFLRYYHVFEENELIDLLKQIQDVQVISNYYDQGNYCCIFEKI